jgi:hypothetical protein
MIRSHTFAGHRYRVRNLAGVSRDALGQCDFERKIVNIPIHGDTLAELDTIIHEAIHAAMPWLTEWIVDKTATSIAKLLWRLGWRRLD